VFKIALTLLGVPHSSNSPSARFCLQCNAPLDTGSASEAMEKKRRMEFAERFIERILQEVPGKGENILREMRKELVELAG